MRKLPYYFSYLFLLLLISTNTSAANKESLVGKVDHETGHYVSINKGFKVALPIKGTKKHIVNSVTDRVSIQGTNITIEPVKGAGTYRLEITKTIPTAKRKSTFPEVSAKAFKWYRRLASQSFHGNLVELITQPLTINDRQAIYAIYKQPSNKNNGPRFHLFYLVDFDNKLAFVWTDIPLKQDDLEIEDKIISGSAVQSLKSMAMLRSLEFE